MYCGYQDREELEDELYREGEDESEASEVNSELEFWLYSQLHYSSNARQNEEEEGRGKEEGEDEEPLEVTDDVPAGVAAGKDSKQSSRDEGGLRQHPEGHTEQQQKKKKKKEDKIEKKQKGKVDPKIQRLTVFQEVIVIDSGTDVITVSDGDTDDGVCALKGRQSKLRTLHTSTPAQQATQKRKRSPSLDSVVVLDSGPGSDSEAELDSDSDSESDSSGLENWMILGSNQDGDHSISLNLEEHGDSSAEDDNAAERRWSVSTKDREALIYNRDKDRGSRPPVRSLSNRYYTDKNVTCRNCNKTGHLSKNCPSQKEPCCFVCGFPGHQAIACPHKHCNNCGLPGHLYKACSEKAYWYKNCHRCGMPGHYLDACPEIWRQYHITTKAGPPKGQVGKDTGRTPPYCYNCSRKGHFGHDCTLRRMFNGTYASTPYINHYDDECEISRRDFRTKKKVKDLKEAGLFSSTPQAPTTPGPPRKRQKTNHHNSSSSSSAPYRHTPNNNKPNNHIRFPHSPENKRANNEGNQSGTAKQWKPKREVPTHRSLPPTRALANDDGDFPHGEEEDETNKKKKKKKKNKKKNVPPGPSGAPFRPSAYVPDRLFGTGKERAYTPNSLFGTGQDKVMKRKNSQAKTRERKAAKKAAAEMYPTDENLFIIKQRSSNIKRKR